MQRAQHHPEEKKRIGELAASLIEDGDIVFINSGTTTTQVLQHIRSDSGITVFTNNVNAALDLGEAGLSSLFDWWRIPASFKLPGRALCHRESEPGLCQ